MKKLLFTLCIAAFASYAFAVNPLRVDSINRIKDRINRVQQFQSLLNKPDRLVKETFSDKEENFNPKTRPEAKTNNSRIFKISQANNKAIIKCDSIIAKTSSNIPESKDEYDYYSNNNLTLDIHYDWDNTSSKWVENYKYEYTYNSNGYETSIIEYDWDNISSEWVESYKVEYTYDSNGNKISSIEYDWHNTSSEWVGNNKDEYTYDSNGNRISDIYYIWDNSSSEWMVVVSYKDEYTYDSNGNETLYIKYTWDDTSSKWIESYKHEFTYDSNGNEILEIYYTWDDTSSKWVGYYKYEHAYDNTGNETLYIQYTWDDTSSKWVENYKYEYTHDSNGNRISSIRYDWENTSSKWVENWKVEYNWDYKYTLQELSQLPFSAWVFNQYNVPIEGKYYDWDSNSNNWKSDYEIETCYYSPLSNTRNSDVQDTKLSIYPNPAKDYIHIDGLDSFASVKIYNLQGSEVLQTTINSDDAISVNNLPKGVYILQITNQERTYKTKLVKE